MTFKATKIGRLQRHSGLLLSTSSCEGDLPLPHSRGQICASSPFGFGIFRDVTNWCGDDPNLACSLHTDPS